MASVGSTGSNKIVKPGYHIRPKYDLHGLRRRRNSDHRGHIAGELPLTSMIDMFSILVIYLLMNFSATGDIFFMNKNLPLPKATSINPLVSAPLVSIIGDNFVLEAPPGYEDSGGKVEDTSPALDRIMNQLKAYKEISVSKNLDSGNRINLQAGEDTELGLIKRAMTASVSAGWTNINFVVDKKK
jgi:biopolymer transport protein ExbD